MKFFEIIGKAILSFISEVGAIMTLFFRTLYWSVRPPFRFGLLIKQFEFIGVQSSMIILLTSIFTGAVFSLQSSYAFKLFEANSMIGPTVVLALTRELGPVLTALMVTGRVGSSIAAEIGTMKVTEQIDALETIAVNPIHYLVVPRMWACVIMVPALSAVFDFIGTVGSYLLVTKLIGIPGPIFKEQVIYYVDFDDFYNGLIKAAVFGLIIAIVGCYKGLTTTHGAEGVGRSTTQSVVISSVTILVSDYFLTALLF